MLDAVEITLEAEAEGIGILVARPPAGADRAGRTRGESDVERRLALLPSRHGTPHERRRARMRLLHEIVVQLHTPRVPTA